MDTLTKARGAPGAEDIPLNDFLPPESPTDMAVQTLRQFEPPPAPDFAPLWARRAFVLTSTAILTVATPVLAGRVVDAIIDGANEGRVVWLAALIAAIAIADAGLGIVSRWLSANIGEGLIFDLRTAVFDHVQRMPIAFFSRTRTGAPTASTPST
mgnify:CR=1 FL=1